MDGILLVDKPEGISSFGVVARIRKILSQEMGKKIKIGHCGTLDPAASGLMILVIGKYTKRAGEFSKMDKTYEAEVTLGQTSTTADREGELTKTSGGRPAKEQIEAVLGTFIGEINQTPPAFSAIKVGGQRAYKLARAGREVKIEPRKVKIYSIKNVSYDYPRLSFVVSVSSGTYIRSLAEDIGEKLGVGAFLSGLRRTKTGSFDVKAALSLERANFEQISANLRQGL